MPNVLLVDDDEDFCDVISQMLTILDYDVTVVHSLADAKKKLNSHQVDHILLDFMLPDGSGIHLIDAVKGKIEAPFITLITGHPSVKTLMSGLCGPKVNYLVKPLRKDTLEAALAVSRDDMPLQSQYERHFDCLIGESKPMQALYTMIERVSRTHANVMLLGESGVGKEVVAQAIHYASNTGKSLVASNCGALSRELIGSELFGHEKGAFTGAVARKIGLFEQAEGGSLFLDEVTEMPIDMQPNLLRVLETQRITRVGGTKEIDINCRVISATNRTHDDLAENAILREDLYFRLAVFPIQIPPLRERGDDIILLANAFLSELNHEHGENYEISPEQYAFLQKHEWPGNVRELRHAIHRAFIMSDPESQHLSIPDDLSSPFAKSSKNTQNVSAGQTIDDVEKELIRVTLAQLDGDKPKAAAMLGISLKTLYNRLNKYGEECFS